MAAGLYNFIIEQGATFYRKFKWTDKDKVPRDLTGYTARMQIREHVTNNVVILELNTENGRIVISPTEGIVELRITSEDTEDLTFITGVFSLQFTSPDEVVTRLLQGNVTLSLAVTR